MRQSVQYIIVPMERLALGFVACLGLCELLRQVYVLGRKSQKRARSPNDLLPDCAGRSELEHAKMHAGRSVGDVQLGPKLGSGSYGVVYAGYGPKVRSCPLRPSRSMHTSNMLIYP